MPKSLMIKIAQRTYRLANTKGLLTEYLVWCMLKSYNSQGTIKKSPNEIAKAAEFIGKSVPTLRRYLTVLVKSGLVRREKFSYSLVSYDKCWKILGLKKSVKFFIFKFENKFDLKAKIEYAEVITNVKLQAWKAKKAIMRDKSTLFTDTEKKALATVQFIDLPQHLDKLYEQKLSVTKNVEAYLDDIYSIEFNRIRGREDRDSYIKITPYLTCYGTAKLLGYVEANSGIAVRERLENVGLANFRKREVSFLKLYDWENAVSARKMRNRGFGRIQEKGNMVTNNLISSMTHYDLQGRISV